MINTDTLIDAIRDRATSTLRDWNPDGCEFASSGYVAATGDNIDLHDEGSVSAYVDPETGATMIGTNGDNVELDESTDYGVAELAALADLRDQLPCGYQADYITEQIERCAVQTIAAHEGLEIVSSSMLPHADLLDADPTIKDYADEGILQDDGTVTVACVTTDGYEFCTWGQTRELDDGTTALDGYAPVLDDVEDLLAVALL